ncbi:hypothetical protein, variant [Magnaporthiopsis poae ATCC 64411]|uniref:Uncharacterized protein n=1 Tax=Magnaporthiopsis poae (strain ATCC 64411 / 73-15) TaxID=644358 RepID=A0A0C4E708_MAGP6|nr:hypothetical protein, variant [Magnaporthiopsis poae ATCC 64411]
MALLSEADLMNSLDDALMMISSGGHHHHHRHAATTHQPSFHAASTAADAADMKPTSDEWSRPYRSSSVSSTSSGSQSDNSSTTASTVPSTPDSDVSRSEPISRASTVSLSIDSRCSDSIDSGAATTSAINPNNTVAHKIVSSGATGITARRQQLDPLARNYPAPAATDKLDLDEMLARKPQKWTLGHYFHKSRAAGYNDSDNGNRGSASVPSLSSMSGDVAAGHRRKSELELAKKELLAAQEEIRRLAVGRV